MDPTEAAEFLAALEAAGIPLPTEIKGSNIRHAHAVTAGASELSGVDTYGNASMIYVAASGDVTLTLADESSLQFVDLAAGVWHPMPPFTHVTAASATGIRAGY